MGISLHIKIGMTGHNLYIRQYMNGMTEQGRESMLSKAGLPADFTLSNEVPLSKRGTLSSSPWGDTADCDNCALSKGITTGNLAQGDNTPRNRFALSNNRTISRYRAQSNVLSPVPHPFRSVTAPSAPDSMACSSPMGLSV